MTSFLVCWAIGVAIFVVRELMSPTTMIRAIQEGNYGGIAFFFAASGLVLGLLLWAVFSVGWWVFH